MTRRFAPIVSLLAIAALLGAATLESADTSVRRDPEGLTVHEWGTFTSVAGADGRPVPWYTIYGQSDLPCFVRRVRRGPKDALEAMVRMETPVVYFYAPREMTANVSVRFRRGAITEWFPDAVVAPEEVTSEKLARSDFQGRIEWSAVRIRPGAAVTDFPTERGGSHYYAARATDAAPVQVGGQTEKYLFYRGVGNFTPPIAATFSSDGRIVVRNTEGSRVGPIVLFENRRGSMTHQIRDAATSQITFTRTAPGDRGVLAQALEKMLIARGLFPKEAAAMVATWRDSWFEEGARLFYVMPKESVDAILPLTVKPTPAAVTRVFVGRVELVTPERQREFKEAILKQDLPTLAKDGRFFPAIRDRVLADSAPDERAALEARLPFIYGAWRYSSGCR